MGSVKVAVVGGPNSSNGGFLPETGTDLTGITFTDFAPASVTTANLATYDTIVLNVSGTLGMNNNVNNLSAQSKADIVSFVGTGHKLIIYNSESPVQNYSWLPYSFATSNPGALGASGTVTVVEENTLSSANPASPYFINAPLLGSGTDAVGDGNVMTTLDAHWSVDMTAKNALNVTGPIHTYAEYLSSGSNPGLMIYNGMDVDAMPSAPATTAAGQLRKVYVQELRQKFGPSDLPFGLSVVGINLTPPTGTDPVGGSHTVTATLKNLDGVPQVNVLVTFSIIAGPNAGASGVTNPVNSRSDANGQVTFTYTDTGGAGTDHIVARFTNSSNVLITSTEAIETWSSPLTVIDYQVLFGSQSYDLFGSTRVRLPWQISGVRAVFSAPITTGGVGSLTGLTTTGLSGLGTNTLTWTISPVSLGNFATTILGTGADAVKDASGNSLVAAGFNENFKVLWGDFNDDGFVASNDMVSVYGATAVTYNIFADLNGDGVVNSADVLIARARLGTLLP